MEEAVLTGTEQLISVISSIMIAVCHDLQNREHTNGQVKQKKKKKKKSAIIITILDPVHMYSVDDSDLLMLSLIFLFYHYKIKDKGMNYKYHKNIKGMLASWFAVQ